MRRLNLKLMAALLAGAAVLGAAVHFLHAFQMGRNAQMFLQRAAQAETDGRPDQEIKWLRHYLACVPKDVEALARYGLALKTLAPSDHQRLQVVDILERVLQRRPERHDVRRPLAHLLMELGRFSDAAEHLQVLEKDFPEDAELERLLGECHEVNRRYKKADQYFAQAIAHDPTGIDSFVRRAAVLRRFLDEPQQADAVIDDMVKANSQAAPAYMARARYALSRVRPDEGGPADRGAAAGLLAAATADVAAALRLAPDDPNVLLTAADLAGLKARLAAPAAAPALTDEARRHLGRALELYPQNEALHRALVDLELRAGRRDEALGCLERALAAVPAGSDGHRELLWAQAELLTRGGKWEEATRQRVGEIIARLRRDGFSPPRLVYLDARVLTNEGSWMEAARRLEELRPAVTAAPKLASLAKPVCLLLGECYRQLGQPDRQYAAYQGAGILQPSDPAWTPTHLGMAGALESMDRIDEALDEYRKLSPRVPEVPVRIARLLILRNLRLPKNQRKWDEFEAALGQACEADPESVEASLLRAEALVAQFPDQPDRARAVLAAARDKHPERAELSVALAALAERQGDYARALKVLDEAAGSSGDSVALRLAYARHWTRRGGAEARPALAKLAEGSERFPADERRNLLRGVAAAFAQTGAGADAARLWQELAEQDPNDLATQLALFRLALQANDEAGMSGALQKIERIDGSASGLTDYAKVRLLTWRASQGDKSVLPTARAALTSLAARRPGWSGTALLTAEMDDLSGDLNGALANYVRAFDLGERSPSVVRRAVQLLFERGRYVEADEVLRRLPELPALGDLQRMAAFASLETRDYDRAARLAEQACAAEPNDYKSSLWLGQILAAVPGRQADAEAALRRAVRLAGNVPAPWVALVQHLARTDPQKAEAAIRQAGQELPPEQAPLALAQCYEALRQRDKAKEHYQAALAARPDDVPTLRSVVNFYLRSGQLADAEPLLGRLIGMKGRAPEDAAWAQLTLGFVLAVGGDPRKSGQALEMVAAAEGADPLQKQRAEAHVLATRPGRTDRLKAIRLLENLDTSQALTANDRFLLAQLYDAVGDWPKARERMLGLLGVNKDNRLFLAFFAQGLVRHNETDAAKDWVARLEKLEPGTLRTLEVKALLLQGQGKAGEAAALLRAFAEGRDGRGRTDAELLHVARLLEKLGDPAAEDCYRKYASSSKRPESVLLLAEYLGRQQRAAEALALCERAAATCSPEAVAGTSVAVLSSAKAGGEACARVARWLEAAARQNPKMPSLRVHLAVVWTLQGRHADAVTLYRACIAESDAKVAAMAMNNLAWLLALKEGNPTHALDLVTRAIEAAGPEPGFLDTRGVVYLKLGRSDLALNDLEEATTAAPSGAGFFHLAQALQMARNRTGAVAALEKAKALGLKADSVDPLERRAYDDLLAALRL